LNLPKYVFDSICILRHNQLMNWDVQFYDAFDAEFEDLPEAVQG